MTLNEVRHNLWTVKTSAFLHRFLSWENTNADVLNVFSALNSSSPQWLSLPTNLMLEKELYGPFVNAANVVLDTCSIVKPKVELTLNSILW